MKTSKAARQPGQDRPSLVGFSHDVQLGFYDDNLPQFALQSAWLGHRPFGRWIVDALRPESFVELGVHNGTSFLTICDAVQRSGFHCPCYGIDTWKGDEHTGSYSAEVYKNLSEYVVGQYETDVHLLQIYSES